MPLGVLQDLLDLLKAASGAIWTMCNAVVANPEGNTIPPHDLYKLVTLIETAITNPGGHAALFNLVGSVAAVAINREVTDSSPAGIFLASPRAIGYPHGRDVGITTGTLTNLGGSGYRYPTVGAAAQAT